MRQSTVGTLTVVLLAGLSAAAVAANDDDPPAAGQPGGTLSGLRQWLGLADRSTTSSPAAPEKAADGRPDSAAAKAVSSAAAKTPDPIAERQREERALQRRLAVIDRLQEIALETNDTELEQATDKLNERTWALYLQRTAHLPASRAAFETDEQILNRHLKPGALSGRPAALSSSFSPAVKERGSGDGAVSNKDSGGRTAVGEDRP